MESSGLELGYLREIIAVLTAGITLLMTLAGIVAIAYRRVKRRVSELNTSFVEIFETFARMPKIEAQVSETLREVKPNGGESLRDAVVRIERTQRDMSDRMAIKDEEGRALSDSDPRVARFTCSPEGLNTFVSETYCRWLNVSHSDLLGWGFLSFIHPDDRDDVREDWSEARREGRMFQRTYRMVPTAGDEFTVGVVIRPVQLRGAVQHWIGILRRVHT